MSIIMAPLSLFISHVIRCLSIAMVLKERGHNIRFVACKKYQKLIEEKGFKIIEIDYNRISNIGLLGLPKQYKEIRGIKAESMNHELIGLVKQGDAIIKSENIDLIVYDGGLGMLTALFKYDIPTVEIRNHIGVLSKQNINDLYQLGIQREFEFDWEESNHYTDKLLRYLEVNNLVNIKNPTKYHNLPVLIPGLKEFELADGINLFEQKSHQFIGPLIWDKWDFHDEGYLSIPSDKFVILISFGSSFPYVEILKTICAALNNIQNCFVIVNGGDSITPDEDEFENKKIIFKPYINLENYLPKVDVIIHHAGHGTVMHAMKHGVPCIAIPSNGDQFEISRQIVKTKIGIRIKKYPESITTEDILSAISELTNNNIYKEQVQHFAKLLEKYPNPANEAANFIEKYYREY